MWTHLTYHALGSVVLVAALVWSRKWPKPADALAKWVRWTLVAGLALTLAGQLLEAVGAFGYPDDAPENALKNVHAVGIAVGPIGILLLLFALGASSALWLGTRFGFRDSRWLPVVVATGAIAAAAFLVGALVFGY